MWAVKCVVCKKPRAGPRPRETGHLIWSRVVSMDSGHSARERRVRRPPTSPGPPSGQWSSPSVSPSSCPSSASHASQRPTTRDIDTTSKWLLQYDRYPQLISHRRPLGKLIRNWPKLLRPFKTVFPPYINVYVFTV